MALGSTQSLTEMSTRSISWGVKAAGAWGFNLLEPSGPVQVCTEIALPLRLPFTLAPLHNNKRYGVHKDRFSCIAL